MEAAQWVMTCRHLRSAPPKTYNAEVWVLSTAAANAVLNVDLLDSRRHYLRTSSSSTVKLTANAWTKLSVSFAAKSSQVYAAFAPSFSGTAKGTIFYWDDMSVTAAWS